MAARDGADPSEPLRFKAGTFAASLGKASGQESERGVESGDGATFVLRRRLIRFLRQHAGSDVLAWESGMQDLADLEAKLHGDGEPSELVKGRIARPWESSGQAPGIFNYAHSTARICQAAGDGWVREHSRRSDSQRKVIRAQRSAGPSQIVAASAQHDP